jgi:tetratricopeptide (TPR) repeat protein
MLDDKGHAVASGVLPKALPKSTRCGNMADVDVMGAIQQAVNIRSAQASKDRVLFDSWPEYFQNTLSHGPKREELRTTPLSDRIAESNRIREEGNALFEKGQVEEAVEAYSRAAGVLRWVESTSADLRSKGLLDKELRVRSCVPLLKSAPTPPSKPSELRAIRDALWGKSSATAIEVEESVVDEGVDAADEERAREALRSAYTNISLAATELKRYGLAQQAARDALRVDPTSAKGFSRLAIALHRDPGEGVEGLREASKSYEAASLLDPLDHRALAAWRNATAELRKAKIGEKAAFSGLFDRGHVVDEEDLSVEGTSASAAAEKRSLIAALESSLETMIQNGEVKEAEMLRSHIEELRKDRPAAVAAPPIDFANPTPDEIERAKAFGIDLSDPDIQAELMELERQRREGKVDELFTSAADAADAAAKAAVDKSAPNAEEGLSEEDMIETVMCLPASELKHLLHHHGGYPNAELDGLSLKELRDKAVGFVKELAQSEREPKSWTSWIPMVITLICVAFFAYRLTSTGALLNALEWIRDMTLGPDTSAAGVPQTVWDQATAGMDAPGGIDHSGDWQDDDVATAHVGANGQVW